MLSAELIGRRVVVRHGTGAQGGAPYRDTLGDLLALDAATALVQTRAGPVEIALERVGLARLVVASTAEQFRLERIAAQGWRARTAVLGADGWLLRADAGWTGRANSALVLRSLRRPLREALADVVAFYAQHRLQPRVSVPLPAAGAVDLALDTAGWRVADAADVMTTRLDLLISRACPLDPAYEVDVAAAPSPEWLAACRYRGGPMPPGGAALLQRHDRAMFASVQAAGRVVAVARGVLDGAWLGITLLDVDAAHRRRGMASALLHRLASQAAALGAERGYLQVAADNAAAVSLYRQLGWHRHHSYVYRVAG